MTQSPLPYVHNGEVFDARAVPVLALEEFREIITLATRKGSRLVALFGRRMAGEGVRLYAVLGHGRVGNLSVLSTDVGDAYPALTPECPQAHWFERELAEQWGVRPEGHPWLKPLRYHHSYRPGKDAWGRADNEEILPCVTDFFRVEGEEVHEVAVGPVHAGIIEPGHFRFQCHGEKVFHLEIALGYQHRGIERALVGGPHRPTMAQMEVVAGDTTIGHALAHCQAIEALSGCGASMRAAALRGVMLEMERLANHTGDLGALAGDVGFLPTASYCGRLRGDFLNLSALLCGSRFGRGMVRPGGVQFDADEARVREFLERLDKTFTDVKGAVGLLWETPSVLARFEETGRLTREMALELGLVGPAARACGVECDVRGDFPTGIYSFSAMPASTWHTGDVFARAFVRWLEIQRSVAFVQEQLRALPHGECRRTVGALEPNSGIISLVEGWRGEVCHVALTDESGKFARYKIVDPSFHNWFGLAMALRNQQVSDFPLCNKSFNLSYAAHDL